MLSDKWGRLATGAAAALLLLPGKPPQAASPDVPLAERIEKCGTCHGPDGNSPDENVPSLAGQPRIFIETQLIYFRERLRQSERMTPQAAGLSDETITALANYYAKLPVKPKAGPVDENLMARGRQLAEAGRCGSCHLPDFSGRSQMPRLAGQREAYLAQAMKSYRSQTRGGPDTTMIDILREVSDSDIRALAHFFAHLGPDTSGD